MLPGMLLTSSVAVAAVLLLCAGSRGGSSHSCRLVHAGSQHFGCADLSCLPLNINLSFMAKRGPLDVHILCTLVGCSIVVLHSGAHAEISLPIGQTLVYGFLIKAFKVEKHLISTLLPLGVGALIAHEQKIKWNYLSSDTRQRDSGR